MTNRQQPYFLSQTGATTEICTIIEHEFHIAHRLCAHKGTNDAH